MAKKYIGITIGPIVKTLMLTTTPAGSWGASYIFSYFTKKLVEKLRGYIDKEKFLVPAQNDEVEKIVSECPWAGLYHDRIIFEIESEEGILEKVKGCIDEVKEELGKELANNLEKENPSLSKKIKEYIKNYIQVHAVLKEVEKNPIIELGKPLDVLELQQGYISKEEINYILKFLENRDSLQGKKGEDRNSVIKNSFLIKTGSDTKTNPDIRWHFLDDKKENSILTIDDIVGVGQTEVKSNAQRKRYYALVNADGDNLGKVLSAMNEECSNEKELAERIKEFSTQCFRYAKEAFEIVEKYGGKMIYAGGDDLLFIAPVVKPEEDKDNIFSLLKSLGEEFAKCFEKFSFMEDNNKKKMGFSAGVMLCYYKYPLNEALSEVLNQLQNSKKVTEKNTISVHFEKHSGKQRSLQFKDFTNHSIFGNVLELLDKHTKSETGVDFLRSVGKKMDLYKSVFIEALKKSDEKDFSYLHRVTENLFEEYPGIFNENDSGISEEAKYIGRIIEILEEIYKVNDKKEEESLKEIETIIGLLSFYNEKETE